MAAAAAPALNYVSKCRDRNFYSQSIALWPHHHLHPHPDLLMGATLQAHAPQRAPHTPQNQKPKTKNRSANTSPSEPESS